MARKPKPQSRVDLHKNRAERARRNDLTRDVHAGDDSIDKLAGSERIRGRNEQSRRRTIRTVSQDGGDAVLEVDASRTLSGRVLSAIGATQCTVVTDSGERYVCTIRRLVRTMSRDARNAVVTGDRVLIEPVSEGEGVIVRVEPRTGIVARGHQNRQHIIVSNVSRLLIVGSAAEPNLKPALIDRFLVSAGKGDVEPIICINKVDLVDVDDLQRIVGWYSQIGCDTVLTSTKTGYGIDRLRWLLQGEQTVFCGQSGVGKSSLLNAIQPGLGLATGEISDVNSKGRHTTRYAQLLPLSEGGWVVDTPGVRQMMLWDVHREEIEGFFPEFRPFVSLCRFPNCLHDHEEDCAVRRAVQMTLIPRLRYESYLRMVFTDEGP